MDVTPQQIEQIDFSEKFRGYDPDQVDDFLEKVGETLSHLASREREATERSARADAEIRSLRERLAAAQESSSQRGVALTDEQEVEQASRTLLMAKRTADASIAEARQEAAEMIADATATADQMSAEAQAHRDELLRRAREDAEREFGDQRNRFAQEIRDLDARKRVLADDIRLLEDRLGEHRSDLERVFGALRTIVEDPTALRARPPLEVDLTPTTDLPGTASLGVSPPAAADATPSPFYKADPESVPRVLPTGATPVVKASMASGTTPEVIAPDAVSVDERGATAEDRPEGSGTADPWGPGSWSEAIESAVDEPFEPADPVSGSARRVAADDDSASSSPGPVELPLDEDVDDAMDAFFETDDPTDGRRFGRRRG